MLNYHLEVELINRQKSRTSQKALLRLKMLKGVGPQAPPVRGLTFPSEDLIIIGKTPIPQKSEKC